MHVIASDSYSRVIMMWPAPADCIWLVASKERTERLVAAPLSGSCVAIPAICGRDCKGGKRTLKFDSNQGGQGGLQSSTSAIQPTQGILSKQLVR